MSCIPTPIRATFEKTAIKIYSDQQISYPGREKMYDSLPGHNFEEYKA